MSINSSDSFNQTETKIVHGKYAFQGSSFADVSDMQVDSSFRSDYAATANDDVFTRPYFIPLDSVFKRVARAEEVVFNTKKVIEDQLLGRIYIDPFVDIDLEHAHFLLWKEVSKKVFSNPWVETSTFDPSSQIEELDIFFEGSDISILDPSDPNTAIPAAILPSEPQTVDEVNAYTRPKFISYAEVEYAHRSSSTVARKFLEEYYELISLSTFSYFYQIRKLLDLLSNELSCIKSSLQNDFGEQYDNEAQQQIALQYDAWAKAAIHYTRRITKTIRKPPPKLPSSEVDQITKKQAAQFQAFFAIRLNAVDEEINDIIANLQRDLVDNCDIFYSKYVSPALRLNKEVSAPLEFDFITTKFQKEKPVLAGEILVITNNLKGNFISVHADMMERLRLMSDKIDGLLMLVHEKKRYSSYISQLSAIAVDKPQILITQVNDVFSTFFRSAYTDSSKATSYISSHGDLDDLEENHHPQYLIRNGGIITGDIKVERGVKIDGVDISRHKHDGRDGSAKISIFDIDYSEVTPENVVAPLSVKVDKFIPDILKGGVPVFDTVIEIETVDGAPDRYEYEIVYTEIES